MSPMLPWEKPHRTLPALRSVARATCLPAEPGERLCDLGEPRVVEWQRVAAAGGRAGMDDGRVDARGGHDIEPAVRLVHVNAVDRHLHVESVKLQDRAVV